jgi:hypothetical protein
VTSWHSAIVTSPRRDNRQFSQFISRFISQFISRFISQFISQVSPVSMLSNFSRFEHQAEPSRHWGRLFPAARQGSALYSSFHGWFLVSTGGSRTGRSTDSGPILLSRGQPEKILRFSLCCSSLSRERLAFFPRLSLAS